MLIHRRSLEYYVETIETILRGGKNKDRLARLATELEKDLCPQLEGLKGHLAKERNLMKRFKKAIENVLSKNVAVMEDFNIAALFMRLEEEYADLVKVAKKVSKELKAAVRKKFAKPVLNELKALLARLKVIMDLSLRLSQEVQKFIHDFRKELKLLTWKDNRLSDIERAIRSWI